MKKIALCCFLMLLCLKLISQDKLKRLLYKEIDTTRLFMEVLYPQESLEQKLPAIIFFFGGGWKGGTIEQFRPQAKYFASRGIIAVLADYRVASRHNSTPFDAVRDAKSAIRFLRLKAEELRIDPDKIIAAGGSAGGHLAAAAGLIEGLEEKGEMLEISSKANALVLFNPVYNNGPGQYGYDRIGERYLEISPFHNIKKGAPPAIVFFGTEDPLVSPETAMAFDAAMEEMGSRCETFLYEGQKHGFFNHSKPKYYRETLYQTDKFLKSLGYLEGEAEIQPFEKKK